MKISGLLKCALIILLGAPGALKAQEPTIPEKLLQNGKLLYETGLLPEAEQELQKAFEISCGDPRLKQLHERVLYYQELVRESRTNKSVQSQHNPQKRGASQLLKVILGTTNLAKQWELEQGSVCKALARLAEIYHLENIVFDLPFCGADVRQIRAGEQTFILVVETLGPRSHPGLAGQQLVLLDMNGSILDRLQCQIDSRYGSVWTELHNPPQPDGSQIVLPFRMKQCYAGQSSLSHNWHIIKHGEAEETFHAPERGPNEWNERGLLRVAIQAGHFKIIFPKLGSH